MNKRNLKILAALSLCFSVTRVQATINAFTTPEPLARAYAYSHYPFARPDYGDCKWWYLDIWGAGLYKSANFAFLNKDTTKKESLSGIFFGADSFTLAETLAPASVPFLNPLIASLLITPNFDYRENTAFFGANIEAAFGCERQWHVGIRTRVPFRDIKVALDSCCALAETLNTSDLYVLDNERWSCPDCTGTTPPPPLTRTGSVPVGEEQTVHDVFAVRLDFASALFLQQSGSPTFIPTPLVTYGNGTTIPDTGIAERDVSNFVPDRTPVYLIESDGGALPTPPFAITQPMVEILPALPADGIGAGTGSKYVFGTDVDYAAGIGANPAAQRNYWVAPVIYSFGDPTLNIAPDANTIRTALNDLLQFHQLNTLALTPISFLAADGVTFDTQRNNGIGDFDVELYGRYDGCTCCWGSWFTEGIFGVIFPTSKRITTPNLLLKVQTGNNHHYEIKLGWFLGWNPCDWFAIKTDVWYHWALKGRESVAAPFVGATVKNIGPTIDANVSWQYFIGEVDFTFIIPCIEPLIGFDLGYQAWVKRKDHVTLPVSSATDFVGIVEPLNASLLQYRTKRIAHTVKAEIFKQTCDWQLFAGWNHTFAGQNSLNDSDWYLGLEVYF